MGHMARLVREPRRCCPDVVGIIGNTPLVELKRLSPKESVRVFAKLEFYNPNGSNGAVEVALDMAEKDPTYYMPYQYGNPANPDAHYPGTAEEILEELDE